MLSVPKLAERRASPRRVVRLPVRFRTSRCELGSGATVDLSDSGAFIRTDDLFPLGTRIEVFIGPRDRQKVATAVVIRILKVPFGERARFVNGMGVRFLRPPG